MIAPTILRRIPQYATLLTLPVFLIPKISSIMHIKAIIQEPTSKNAVSGEFPCLTRDDVNRATPVQ